MKKLLCLLLALVMVLSLAACSDSDSDSGSKRGKKDKEEEEVIELEDGIIGTWTMGITFTEEMLQVEGVNIEDLPVIFTFDEDGEVTLSFSEAAVEIFEEKLLDAMEDMVYAEMEAEGMSRDEIDELFETYYGMSVTDYMKDALDEADVLSMLTELEETHDYEVDGDKLIIDGTEMTAEIKGDKLTITDCEDEDFWSALGLETPITMERD